ncbi:MAG TPA: hypothetical protein VER96_27410 [Polyangiaceae bacterium]|nr:hypothetical protein [Polyangiaceae bacterium]
MSGKSLRWRRSLAAASLGAACIFSGMLGCQAIADIPDVTYSARCDEYCDQEINVCAGVASQYQDRRTCMEVCTVLDKNANGSDAKIGNTIPCRLERLRSAALAQSSDTADFLEYCTQSGPGGGNACTLAQGAPDCEGYCTLYGAACGGDSHNPFMGQLPDDNSGSQAECIEKCKAVQPITDHEQPNSGYTWQSGKASGDTLGCRLYFVSAAVVDPAANCDFAGIRPAGACLGADSKPNCDNFCLALTTACQGELSVYESFDQCKAVCLATAPGTKQSTTPENTIGCRSAHEFNALLISAHDHCPHIGPLGAGVCGDSKKGGNCEAYCSLAEKACDKAFAPNFSGHADCVDKCSKFKGADQGDYSVAEAKEPGDTVQCRGLAVSQALAATSAEDRTKACAAVFGAAPCSD